MATDKLKNLLEQEKEIGLDDITGGNTSELDNESTGVPSDVDLNFEDNKALKELTKEHEQQDGILKFLQKSSDFALTWFVIFASFQALVRFFDNPTYSIFDGNGMNILITGVFAQTIGVVTVIANHLWKKRLK